MRFLPFAVLAAAASGLSVLLVDYIFYRNLGKEYVQGLVQKSKIFELNRLFLLFFCAAVCLFVPVFAMPAIFGCFVSVVIWGKLRWLIHKRRVIVFDLSRSLSASLLQSAFFFVFYCFTFSYLHGAVDRSKLYYFDPAVDCELHACVDQKMIVERIDIGFLTFSDSRLFLIDMDERIITSARFESQGGPPLICRVLDQCYWPPGTD